METMNYAGMNEQDKKYEQFCAEVCKIRGVEVYDSCDDEEDDYVECGIISDTYIDKVRKVIAKYGYTISEEFECEGSDYPSYCIWFGRA